MSDYTEVIGNYRIEGHNLGAEGWRYNIYENNIIFPPSNIESLQEAKNLVQQYIKTGGSKATTYATFKGKQVPIRTYGGAYPDTSKIDKEIRLLILELNSEGYATSGSCAGHYGLEKGFITFVEDYGRKGENRIREIMTTYGLTGIKWERNPKMRGLIEMSTVYFDSVGAGR